MINKFISKLRNFKAGYKKDGISYIINIIMWRVPHWFFHYNHSLLFATDKPRIILRKYPDYVVRAADMNDIDAIERLEIYPKGKTARRLKQGDYCHIVLKGEEVVSIIWAKLGKMFAFQAGSVIDTGDNGFFLDGLHTIDRERLKGLHMAVYKSLFDHMASLGRHHIMGIVNAPNKVSIETHRRMNLSIVGETFYFTLIGMSVCYYKTWPGKTGKIHVFFKRPPGNLDWV
jgi:L-amino acid N-acyltransferase YncA